MKDVKFLWTVGEHQYVLVPEIRWSSRKSWLVGAGMYSLDGEYIGYWARFNMPIPLIRQLTAHARQERAKAWREPLPEMPSKTRRGRPRKA